MKVFDYLALLSWQNCKIQFRDFELLARENINNPEKFSSILSSLETRNYLNCNKNWWKKAEQDYKYCQKKSYKIYSPFSKNYPDQILNFYDSVPIFLVLGELVSNLTFPITFVGSRQPEELVLNWMDVYLPSFLERKSVCIVSGGARGIDQKAHKIAICYQKPTLCFLPSGLDHIYPQSLKSLKSGILNHGGAFVSCFPPWEPMKKSYFHIRNSFLSSYSKLVVILQAQIRSGTMITARKALEFASPIAVLPGPILSAQWTGSLQLLYDGAYMIRDATDLSILVESLQLKSF
ncbi:MAG: DNA-processing protein DprA [Bdellovibrionales bacterium]|nr:DNA-processing protein DprA [Bdellovibrionales bacterium]